MCRRGGAGGGGVVPPTLIHTFPPHRKTKMSLLIVFDVLSHGICDFLCNNGINSDTFFFKIMRIMKKVDNLIVGSFIKYLGIIRSVKN